MLYRPRKVGPTGRYAGLCARSSVRRADARPSVGRVISTRTPTWDGAAAGPAVEGSLSAVRTARKSGDAKTRADGIRNAVKTLRLMANECSGQTDEQARALKKIVARQQSEVSAANDQVDPQRQTAPGGGNNSSRTSSRTRSFFMPDPDPATGGYPNMDGAPKMVMDGSYAGAAPVCGKSPYAVYGFGAAAKKSAGAEAAAGAGEATAEGRL